MTELENAPAEPAAPEVLAVDVGGSHVKMLVNGDSERRRFVSGPDLTPGEMVKGVLDLAGGSEYGYVSAGSRARPPRRARARQPGTWLGRIRLRSRVRQADEGPERRRHAGVRQLYGRPHALSRSELPENVRLGHNEDAFLGGFRLWVPRQP